MLPVSFFEKSGLAHYNAIAVVDADGSIVGHYRKSHIPDFPLYEEKYLLQSRGTQVSACSIRHTGVSGSVSAGTSGFRKRPGQ